MTPLNRAVWWASAGFWRASGGLLVGVSLVKSTTAQPVKDDVLLHMLVLLAARVVLKANAVLWSLQTLLLI